MQIHYFYYLIKRYKANLKRKRTKSELTTDTCSTTGESQKRCAEETTLSTVCYVHHSRHGL